MTNSFKNRMISGEQMNGCFINLFSPAVTEIVSQAGYDALLIDLEHGPGDYMDAITHMQSMAGSSATPLIRVVDSHSSTIKKAMDIGPHGIMVPNIRNADEARHVVEASRYPPKGFRGAAPPVVRGSMYGISLDDYFRFLEEDFLTIVQIESMEAVEDLENICDVEGIDMIFIGPTDLSGSLGRMGDYDSEEFKQVFERIEKVTLEKGKLLGTIPFPNWSTERLFQNGHHLVLCGFDAVMVRDSALSNVKEARKAANRN